MGCRGGGGGDGLKGVWRGRGHGGLEGEGVWRVRGCGG